MIEVVTAAGLSSSDIFATSFTRFKSDLPGFRLPIITHHPPCPNTKGEYGIRQWRALIGLKPTWGGPKQGQVPQYLEHIPSLKLPVRTWKLFPWKRRFRTWFHHPFSGANSLLVSGSRVAEKIAISWALKQTFVRWVWYIFVRVWIYPQSMSAKSWKKALELFCSLRANKQALFHVYTLYHVTMCVYFSSQIRGTSLKSPKKIQFRCSAWKLRNCLNRRAVFKTLVVCCIEGIILPSYMGIVISHYKNPY